MNTPSTSRSFVVCRREAMVSTCQPFGATGALKSRGARGGLRSSSFSVRAALGSASLSTPTKPSSCMPIAPGAAGDLVHLGLVERPVGLRRRTWSWC